MTTTAHLPAQTFPGHKAPFYPSHPFLPFQMPSTYTYPAGATGYNSHTLAHLPMASSFYSGGISNHNTTSLDYSTNVNGQDNNNLLSPTTSQSLENQLSPTEVENSHKRRGRMSSTEDGNISPIPTSSPVGPLLSPNSQVPLAAPSASLSSSILSLPPLPHPKTAYNIPAATNGYSVGNGFVTSAYGGSGSTRLSTQPHFHTQNNLSHTPSTMNSALFGPPYTVPPVSAVPTVPPPSAMPNVVMYPPPPGGQVDYMQTPSVNLWGHYSTGKLSYDTPRYKLTPERATPLQKWFDDHKDHPYPTRHDKITLCHDTNLTFTQVSTWFANCRRRLKKAMQEDEERQGPTTNESSTGSSYHEESSNGSYHNSRRSRSDSPDSDGNRSVSHDSDDKLHNYGPDVTEDYTTNCSYHRGKHSTSSHH